MEELKKLMLEGFEKINKRLDTIENKIDGIEDMIRNLEASNGARHIEISSRLDLLEEVTAHNWNDIIRLKKAK